eukprot:365052-Chlamydomonas_euryale.AAC.35
MVHAPHAATALDCQHDLCSIREDCSRDDDHGGSMAPIRNDACICLTLRWPGDSLRVLWGPSSTSSFGVGRCLIRLRYGTLREGRVRQPFSVSLSPPQPNATHEEIVAPIIMILEARATVAPSSCSDDADVGLGMQM